MWVEAEHYKIVAQREVSSGDRGQRRVDVVELLVISRVLGVDPLDIFVEIAKAAGL